MEKGLFKSVSDLNKFAVAQVRKTFFLTSLGHSMFRPDRFR